MKSLTISLLACTTAVFAAPGDGAWAAAYSKATMALAKLSNTQKVSLATGVGWQKGGCVGNIAPISSIGFPELCLQDSPLGVRYAQGVTAFPAGIMTGSTWDTGLMYDRGNALGTESKALGVHVQLGPVAGPLGKIPVAGRNWEGFSNDPYLSGIAMANTVSGMQAAGVQACAKHFLGNEQELNRGTMSADIADRVTHELYLWGFAEAVRANVASVMCSYNKFNTTWSCESEALLTGLLKDELDFQGYIVSDWTAQHTTTGSANAGMDMSMPGDNFGDNNFLWGQNLLNAVSSGSVPQSRLDDMATRILASWYFVGQDSGYPTQTGWTSWNGGGGGPNVQGTHSTVARAIARDGIVLLKNTNNALPLNKPASLAIIGQDAVVNPAGPNACTDRSCDTGTLAMGWGSGTAQFPYLTAPYDAISTRAATDGTKVTLSNTDTPSAGASAASAAATAIVFINSDSGEGYITVEGAAGDRLNLDPWHSGNNLVSAVAAVNKNTIVVIHSVGPLVLETILALPNVVAVVWAGIPGQESGNALVDILYGSTSPSGKLPYTIGKQQSDYGTAIANGDDSYSEGLYIDYRHFDNAGIAPRYEFGFGLSYTTFAYSSLVTGSISNSTGSGATAPGGVSSLWDVVATVTATVTNTGTVAGAEVAQLYIGLPSSAPATPLKQLRGFDKLSLAAGAVGTVTFPLRAKDLSYWDSATAAWVLPTGTFNIYVGASSRDIRLTGTIFSAGSGGSGSSSKWTSLGCYTDSVTARTLGYTAAVPGGATAMTVEACQTVCLGLGYTLAGVEYADECYCGDSLLNGGGPAPDGNALCNMACTGNAAETCGGPNRLDLYSYTTAPSAAWNFRGCYTDSVAARTLGHTEVVLGGATATTVEACQAICYRLGYTLAGVEYADECYCDNSLQNGGTIAPDGNLQCNMSCAGNTAETCGGGNRLDLYSYGYGNGTALPSATWNFRGCYTDSVAARTLGYTAAVPGGATTMTVEACQAVCHGLGYTLAGVEYADECYCDNSLQNGGTIAPDGNLQCNMPCDGNTAETCGGGNRLDLYSYGYGNGTAIP